MTSDLKFKPRPPKKLTSLLGLALDGRQLEGVVLRRTGGALAVRRRPEAYFAAKISIRLGFGGRNSNGVFCSAR